jgi:hypothetical protein
VYLIKPSSSRRYVAFSFFLFSLRALVLVLFCPNPDSHRHSPPVTFNFDAAEPPFTPSRRCLSVAIPLDFTTYPVFSLSLPFSGRRPSLSHHLADHTIRVIRLVSDTVKSVSDHTLDQTSGSRNRGVPMCEVHAGHLFHFSVAQCPKRREGVWKVILMALLGRLGQCW